MSPFRGGFFIGFLFCGKRSVYMEKFNIRALAEAALMIALATILSLIVVFKAPYGGSVTLASMVPIVLVSYRNGTKIGLLAALGYSLLQMSIGFYPPPVQTMTNFVLVIFLDYILAFGALGLAGFFARFFSNDKKTGIVFSCLIVMFIRFMCHFISGIIIWGTYAPEGQPVYLYSLLYNGTYMLIEAIISSVVLWNMFGKIKMEHV